MKIRKIVKKFFAEALLHYRHARFSQRKEKLPNDMTGLNLCDVFYINLTHRTDRRLEIEKEFQRIGLNNYTRFEACQDDNGSLGCSRSHRALLGHYSPIETRMLMICEDDCQFIVDRAYIDGLVNEFYVDANLDVLCLAFNKRNGIKISDKFYFTSDTQTTACYILKSHMIPEMINTANESIFRFENRQMNKQAAIDVVWKELQKKFVFIVPLKRAVKQSASYSDIERTHTNYGV